MALDPLRKTDRSLQVKVEKGDAKSSITLYDVDYSIMSYLQDVVLPKLEHNGKSVAIPVVYGNAERWTGARREGVYRDSNGKINLPIMMLRRSSVAKSADMSMLNRHVTYTALTKWSKDNRYDRFSAMGASRAKPKYDIYKITMPDYIDVTYDCMGWTNYTEHLNSVVEALTFASDEYWGDKHKFKFNTKIENYNITTDVGGNIERINRVEFQLNVRAYLLPDKYDGQTTTQKNRNSGRVIFNETDATANGRLEEILISPSAYYDNKDLIDFLSLNGSKTVNPNTINIATFTGIKLIGTPPALSSAVTPTLTTNVGSYDVKVFVNGVRMVQGTNFTATYSGTTLTITFNPANVGYNIELTDEVTITSKFIDV